MMMKVRLQFQASLAAVVALLLSLSVYISSVQAQTTSKETYKIGTIFSLTGSFANVGSMQQRAIALEIERLNSKGGIKGQRIEHISYDDQSQAETAGLLVKKLAKQDKVSVILGPTGAWTIMPIKPVIQQIKIPDIASGAITINPGDKYLFNLVVGVEMGIEVYMNFAKKRGWTQIASLQTMDDVGDRAVATLKSLSAQYGIQVVGEERFNTQDKDITPQLSKLKAAKPQALMSWCSGDAAVLVYKNMRQLGMDIPYMPSGGAASSRFFKLIGDVPKENLLFTLGGKLQVLDSVPDSDPVKAPGLEFRQMYMAKFNAPPENLEAVAWDLTAMAVNAMKAVGTNPEKVRNYIENIKMSGLQASYVMTPSDHNGVDKKSVIILMGLGGKWQVVP
jgi:branched-chain amino acid transport system substrate-binding protein